MKNVMRMAVLTLALLFALPAAAEMVTQMPPLLTFKQETVSTPLAENISLQCVYPDTANDDVDAQMRVLIDAMMQAHIDRLPLEATDTPSYLDVGAVISRSGESVLSFLTLAEGTREKELLFTAFETRVYDIETGRQLSLSDLFEAESGAWELLAQEAEKTLRAAFPGIEPDEEALEALCSEEAIREASFTLGAARLTLTYRADALYPGKKGLLHVNIGYSKLREMMSAYGKRQTDNSRFPMIALTFDDGGARGSTRAVLKTLQEHGAQATFFIVGEMIAKNHDNMLRQQNGNYSIQNHSYTHTYPDFLAKDEAYRERQRMEAEIGELTGVVPTMMRAPGGHAAYYVRKGIGYPMIHWSLAGGDAGNDDVRGIANRVIVSADDGEIVLLHDLNYRCATYTAEILDALTAKGFLCVTVEELFEDAGVTPQVNTIYVTPTMTKE